MVCSNRLTKRAALKWSPRLSELYFWTSEAVFVMKAWRRSLKTAAGSVWKIEEDIKRRLVLLSVTICRLPVQRDKPRSTSCWWHRPRSGLASAVGPVWPQIWTFVIIWLELFGSCFSSYAHTGITAFCCTRLKAKVQMTPVCRVSEPEGCFLDSWFIYTNENSQSVVLFFPRFHFFILLLFLDPFYWQQVEFSLFFQLSLVLVFA